MVTYKCSNRGIEILTTEESYTSKCSLLDFEAVQKHEEYLGRRVKRGLFRSSDGRFLNADVNGAGNILRKAVTNAFPRRGRAEVIEGFVVSPVCLTIDIGGPKPLSRGPWNKFP